MLALPTSNHIRKHMLVALSRYWPNEPGLVSNLPINQISLNGSINGPLRMVKIKLPEWAIKYSVDGFLLIPNEAIVIKPDRNNSWEYVDWWLAGFLLLEACHERAWEYNHGPIHSYSFRLKNWDERAWEYAWVNRMGMFLRTWAIYRANSSLESKLGSIRDYDFQLTHDVDAVKKTWSIRIKQSSFNFLNSLRYFFKNDIKKAKLYFSKGINFATSNDDWWLFDELFSIEKSFNIKAIYHFHADRRKKSPKRWLFDPNYKIESDDMLQLLKQIKHYGHKIGLHPGFDSWQESSEICAQRKLVEEASNIPIMECRQHWLRFSWNHTWVAQKKAGLTHDRTLMFNDRPGFRNSSALTYHPWNFREQKPHKIIVQPTIFMDSHLYDYKDLNSSSRKKEIKYWISECKYVQGSVSILWHPHTLSKDYSWLDGFKDTLREIAANS